MRTKRVSRHIWKAYPIQILSLQCASVPALRSQVFGRKRQKQTVRPMVSSSRQCNVKGNKISLCVSASCCLLSRHHAAMCEAAGCVHLQVSRNSHSR